MKSENEKDNGKSYSGRPPRGGRGLKLKGGRHMLLPTRRPPRGGRGLKLPVPSLQHLPAGVAPLAEA